MSHTDGGIGTLNGFLRGEIAAVETYRHALELSAIFGRARATLRACLGSHERRVVMFEDEIRRMGGVPAISSGVWGTFAKLVEKAARAIGTQAAVSALERGEGLGRDDYQRVVRDLPMPARTFMTTRIIPEQQRTHDAVCAVEIL